MQSMIGSALAIGASRVGQLFRSLVMGVLMTLEPLVRWVCSTILVGGLFISVVFELSAAGSGFPFLFMAGASLAFGLLLIAYYGLIAIAGAGR